MKFKSIKFVLIIFVILILIFLTFKITTKNNKNKITESQSTDETQYQNNIRIGVSNFDTINPLITTNKQMIAINQLIYEPLLELDSEYKLTLCLATEYAKTTATTYIVKVNNNIKWSNGTNFTANDVKFTVNLLKSINNIYSENVKYISNVEAIDDSTVKITLSQEVPFFECNLIFPIMSSK